MFNLLDYGKMVSSQWYYLDKTYNPMAMIYKTKDIKIDMYFDSKLEGYTGIMKMKDTKESTISMASLDNPLQRILMKLDPSNISFYRYDTAEIKDDEGYTINLVYDKKARNEFNLSIDKFNTVGLDHGKYAIVYNARNRIQEKYFVLDDNNIGFMIYDCNERPKEFCYYNANTYEITTIPLGKSRKYYISSPEWYTISDEFMRIKSEKFDVISFPGKNEIISFGVLGFDPFDWNNNKSGKILWFSDKLESYNDKMNLFCRNIIEIDWNKEKELYKDIEKFYIGKS